MAWEISNLSVVINGLRSRKSQHVGLTKIIEIKRVMTWEISNLAVVLNGLRSRKLAKFLFFFLKVTMFPQHRLLRLD